MNKSPFRFLLSSFISWRVLLLAVVFLAAYMLPLQKDFLGGGISNYLKNPYFWSWLNFDGEHYAQIAFQGYLPLTYFFFPFYPLLARVLASFSGGGLSAVAVSGLLVSNVSFFVALWGLWKLILLDYKEAVAKTSIILLLLFPASFYFGAFYTESLTLALVVWSLYLVRKKRWLLAGILGALSTATRITALALVPAFLYEVWMYRKQRSDRSLIVPIISSLLIPLGLLGYMLYLNQVTGDPLEFFNNVAIFGEQRSSSLVILPQVFFRYFFKILPNINYSYFPVVFTTYLEIVSASIFLALGIWSFYKLRLSYALFFAAGYLIPPLSGSFSSFPRYLLILFPAFLLSGIILNGRSRLPRRIVYVILFVLLVFSCGLFVRGYWVS